MTKETLKSKIIKIGNMGEKEIEEFEVVLARSSLVGRARGFLIRAIEIRKEEIRRRSDAVAIDGDIDDTDY